MEADRRSILAAFTSLAIFRPRAVHAQRWPSRSISLLVPFAPGPAVDFVARLVGRKISESLGQAIVVENRLGANGAIASSAVARAEPGGYTLLIATAGTHVTSVHLTPDLPYDPVRDFTPIIAAVEPITCLAVNANLPVNTVSELIDYARARPGELSYGSSGAGSVFHLMGELFNNTAGVKIKHVAYRGVEPAMRDVIGNHIPMTFISIANALPAAEAGQVRILAVLEPERFSRQPQIPSMSELVPGFGKPSSWFGFFGPANMPPQLVEFLNAEINKALNASDAKQQLENLGFAVIGGSSTSFANLIRNGIEVYGTLIRNAGLAVK